MKTRLAIVLAALALLTSCVHEFPVTTPANVDLVLTFDTKMSYYNTRLFPDETSQIPDVNAEPSTEVPSDEHLFVPDYAKMGDYDLRYTIEAYRQIAEDTYSSQPVQRWVLTDADATKLDEYAFQVTLDEGRYIFRAWADFVPEGSTADYHYNTQDWSYGIWFDYRKYVGNTESRDTYVGSTMVDVVRLGSSVAPVRGVLEMKRNQARYVFLTNDLDEFITKVTKGQARSAAFDIDDYVFEVEYTNYFPQRYSISADMAVDSAPTAKYVAKLTQIDDKRAIMGFDFVITGTDGRTFVPLQVRLKTNDGTILAEHTNINVPVLGNHYTIVEGRFLMQESNGGIAIDPGFGGPDIVVRI